MYFLIQDFAAGLDLRKLETTAKAGSLRQLKNAYINAGGEICKRYKLSQFATLPANTKGLHYRDGQLHTFGTAGASGITVPSGFTYTELTGATGTIDKILKAETFGDKNYVVGNDGSSTPEHFYDGARVTDQSPKGPHVRSYKSKMFHVDERNLLTSAVDDPTDLDPAASPNIGQSIVDMQREDGLGGDLMCTVPYYSYLAVMGRSALQLWAFDPDPALSQHIQTLGQTGLIAHNAASSYANGDVLYLTPTGIRSIRARDSSNAAVMNDIGSPIDELIRARRITDFTGPQDPIYAITDPVTGHWWLCWGNTVFVLAYYPSSKVTAWSVYEFDVPIDYITAGPSRLYIRSGNDVYHYGAVASGQDPLDPVATLPVADAEWYDNAEVTVETPFLDIDDPASEKDWNGLDMACSGEWIVSTAGDPLRPDTWREAGRPTGTTFSRGDWGLAASSSHLRLQFKSTSVAAKLASVALHYKLLRGG